MAQADRGGTGGLLCAKLLRDALRCKKSGGSQLNRTAARVFGLAGIAGAGREAIVYAVKQ